MGFVCLGFVLVYLLSKEWLYCQSLILGLVAKTRWYSSVICLRNRTSMQLNNGNVGCVEFQMGKYVSLSIPTIQHVRNYVVGMLV